MVKVINKTFSFNTKGSGDLVDITEKMHAALRETDLKKGTLNVFVVGSTAAITTFEFEPGLIKDIRDLFERIAPAAVAYNHDETWHDANGFSHVRASLQGPSLTVPFEKGKLLLGTWQQVVLAEFDNRPRKRQIIATLTGE